MRGKLFVNNNIIEYLGDLKSTGPKGLWGFDSPGTSTLIINNLPILIGAFFSNILA